MAYKYLLIFLLVGVIGRIVPHVPNFTPIAAMALFGGSYMSKKQAITLPLLAMIISDIFIGFDSLGMRVIVYASFLATIFIGFWLRKRINTKNVILSSLAGSILFFVTTNFGVWILSAMYPHTLEGLLRCYFFALPFFRNTILGDLFYCGVFFGGYYFIKNKFYKNRLSLES